jgi:hypothetical protein
MTPERWQQITGIFHAALLRDSGERRLFLRDACGGDEELHAEVDAMLAAHIILAVEDNGTPSLTPYRRVILDIAR